MVSVDIKHHVYLTQRGRSKIISLKPGVGENVTLHASPSAMNSTLLISTYPVYSTLFSRNPLSTARRFGKWEKGAVAFGTVVVRISLRETEILCS